jgi:hypothetical protein
MVQMRRDNHIHPELECANRHSFPTGKKRGEYSDRVSEIHCKNIRAQLFLFSTLILLCILPPAAASSAAASSAAAAGKSSTFAARPPAPDEAVAFEEYKGGEGAEVHSAYVDNVAQLRQRKADFRAQVCFVDSHIHTRSAGGLSLKEISAECSINSMKLIAKTWQRFVFVSYHTQTTKIPSQPHALCISLFRFECTRPDLTRSVAARQSHQARH